MNTRKRVAAVVAALATAVTGTAMLPSQVDASAKVPAIKVTMTKKAIRLSTHSVQAGRVRFRVVTPGGDHVLQVMRLHQGYSLQQAAKDVGRAFQGRVPAIKRVDRRITWAGGAETRKNHPGRFAVTLTPGTYYLIDQNDQTSTVVSTLTVNGSVQPRAWIHNSSRIVGTGKDRFRAPKAIPRQGWTVFKDTSDEPHFLVLQQVKHGTTRHMVTRYLHSGAQGEPPFAMPATTSSGVISGGSQILFHYNLPRGRYVLICWWPSDENGMPHALMGMYRMINLR